jgi:FMN phosphatase YigB (HAD superfamily)
VIKITQPNLNENSFNQSNTVTNSQKFITTVSNFFKVPIENAEKVLSEILFNVFPELEPFFYPISGAREFLDWAKSKYKLILATQPVWPQEIIEMRCKWAKIDPKIFSSITHSSRMSFFKPDTKYYEQILEQENLKPDECLMIGNDLKNDLAAVKVGIPVFIVNKKNFLKEIKTPDAKAQALSGNFKILRQILEN